MRRQDRLRLPVSLADVFGRRVLFNVRRSFNRHGWSSGDAAHQNPRTAIAPSIAGAMPYTCSVGVVWASLAALLERAGAEPSGEPRWFDSAESYTRCLDDAVARGESIAHQHVHPPGERSDEEHWVPRDVLTQVNDKARLGEFVPAEFVPPRRVLPVVDWVREALREENWPLVVKGAGSASSGGGTSVVIVERPVQLLQARKKLADSEQIVLEQFIEVNRNCCVMFATVGNETVYLGGSEQRTSRCGAYLGNWLESATDPSPLMRAVGEEIMARARAIGYRGLAGFDMVEDSTGRLYVIDLNFRINGSTPALLWRPALWRRFGSSMVGLFDRTLLRGRRGDLLHRLGQLVDGGDLFPLALFETPFDDSRKVSRRDQVVEARPRERDEVVTLVVPGLWMGRSRSEALNKLGSLHDLNRAVA